MSGSASLTLEQGILQHTLGIAALAFPAQVYVALCAAGLPPSESVGGVEAFGGGYSRVAATFALLASPTNIAANTQSVEFPLASAGWGELGYFEIWSAQTGGSRLYWGGLVDPVTGDATTLDVSAGDIVRFSAGTLAIEVAAPTAAVVSGVSSFNTRVGDVVLSNSDVVAVLPPSANPPLMDGTAAVGTSAAWARGDHVHPSDTSLLSLGGGTVTGLVTLSGAGVVLSVANGLNITSNFSGSGFPALWNTNRMVFARQTTSVNDFCDFQFQRTTSFTGGTQASLLACVRVVGNYGAGDGCNNWNIVSQAQTHGTSGGLTVGTFSTAQRLSGATDTIFGAVLNGTDLTGLPSATSGGAVLGVEVDCQVQDRDTRTNPAMFGGTGNRIGVDIVAVRNGSATSPPTEVSAGLWFTSSNITGNAGAGVTADPYTNYLSAISFGVNTQAYQALDTRGAIVPTGVADPFAAVRMLHDQIIDFNGGTTLKSVAGNYLQYRGGTQRLYYVVGGVDQWSVDASGNMRARGTVTGSTTP